MTKSKDQTLIAHPINSVNNIKNKEKVVVVGGGNIYKFTIRNNWNLLSIKIIKNGL